MTMLSDLPYDLLEEILSRVPLTCLSAVRSTCKTWNNLSKDQILCNAKERQQFLGLMRNDYRVCSIRFNFQGILLEDGEELVESSIKPIGNLLYQVKISKVVHCDGLLLCITLGNTELVVWNPYLCQTRWIQLINVYQTGAKYALGYDDNNRNHKILRLLYHSLDIRKSIFRYEIFGLKSNSWRVLDIIPEWDINMYGHGVSLKGNTYFIAGGKKKWQWHAVVEKFLICFDFTRERFGPRLPLPFYYDVVSDIVGLSSVREEQLAVLFGSYNTSEIKIWTTTKIEPHVVSWIPFLKVDNTSFKLKIDAGSFFIDQEKKLAVVCKSRGFESKEYKAYIFGENGYMKKVGLGEAAPFCRPRWWCSYVPSLVQINQSSTVTVVQKERRRLFICLLNHLPSLILLLGFLLFFCRFLLI